MKNFIETTLKNFIDEQFDLETLFEIGLLKPELKGDYKGIAKRICHFFGFNTIYEYGTQKVRAHLSYCNPENPLESTRPLHVNGEGQLKVEPFVTEFESWLED